MARQMWNKQGPSVSSVSVDCTSDKCIQLSFAEQRVGVTVQTSSATWDLTIIQKNKFYWISNRSGIAYLHCYRVGH